jgi:hypothetical protein
MDDIFSLLGISVETKEITSAKTKSLAKKEATTNSKAKESTSAAGKNGKGISKTVPPQSKSYQTQKDMRLMPIGLDWEVHYARHTFSVEALAKSFVEMDEELDINRVKEALWSKIPVDVQTILLEVRRIRSEKANEALIIEGNSHIVNENVDVNVESVLAVTDPLVEAGQLESSNPVKLMTNVIEGDFTKNSSEGGSKPTVNLMRAAFSENGSNEDELDAESEDEDELEESESKESTTEVKNENKAQIELLDGDLTLDMVRQALTISYFEFSDQEHVSWVVNKEHKSLIPSISAGKMGYVL